MMVREVLGGGFADSVFDSQAVFRRLLDAMARPGTIVTLPECVSPPLPLSPAAAAVVAALADEATPVFLDAASATAAAAAWVTFHTGARVVDSPAAAAFVIFANPAGIPPFDVLRQGTDEYPDRSGTVVLQIDRLETAPELELTGPGIRDRMHLAAAPLPPDFAGRMATNRAAFPRGIDLILAADRRVIALPRSVRVRDLQVA